MKSLFFSFFGGAVKSPAFFWGAKDGRELRGALALRDAERAADARAADADRAVFPALFFSLKVGLQVEKSLEKPPRN